MPGLDHPTLNSSKILKRVLLWVPPKAAAHVTLPPSYLLVLYAVRVPPWTLNEFAIRGFLSMISGFLKISLNPDA